MYSDRDPRWEPIALTLQANLAPLGIDVKLEKIAQAAYRERLGKGEFEIAIGNWSPDFADPYMFMNYWFDSKKQGMAGNRSFYTNPKVDELVRTRLPKPSRPSASSCTSRPRRSWCRRRPMFTVPEEHPDRNA